MGYWPAEFIDLMENRKRQTHSSAADKLACTKQLQVLLELNVPITPKFVGVRYFTPSGQIEPPSVRPHPLSNNRHNRYRRRGGEGIFSSFRT
jgi:hypothetical protein